MNRRDFIRTCTGQATLGLVSASHEITFAALANLERSLLVYAPRRVVTVDLDGRNAAENDRALTAALSSIASLAPARAARCKLLIRSTEAVAEFSKPFAVPIHIDIEQAPWLRLVYVGTDFTTPAIVIGNTTSDQVDAALRVQGLNVHCGLMGRHKMCGVQDGGLCDLDHFAGVRISNQYAAQIEVVGASGFPVGVQLMPAPAGFVGHCWIRIGGEVLDCKTLLDLRGNADTGWVNENRFVGPGNLSDSSRYRYGSMTAIRFSAEPGGYEGNNNNIFNDLCFQLNGGGDENTFVPLASVEASDTVTARAAEYVVIQAGNLGERAPSHVAGVARCGTSVLKYVGPFRRTLLANRGAGGSNHVIGGRLETSYGPIVVTHPGSVPAVTGRNTTVELTLESEVTDAANPIHEIPTDIEIVLAQDQMSSGSIAESFVRVRGNLPYDETLTLRNIHKRAVVGADGCYVPGLLATQVWSNQPALASCRPAARVILTRSGLYFPNENDGLGLLIPLSNEAPWIQCSWSGLDASSPPRVRFTALDEALGLLPAKAPFPLITNAGLASDGVFSESANFYGSYYALRARAACGYAVASFRGGVVANVTIMARKRAMVASRASASVLDDSRSPLDGPRMCAGLPLAGIFEQAGQRLFDLNSDASWRVTVSGILAPPWTRGSPVVAGEYRSVGGQVFFAASGGACGHIEPKDAAISTSDGNLEWIHAGPVAVLSASKPSLDEKK